MQKWILLLILFAIVNHVKAAESDLPADQVVATVNSKTITAEELNLNFFQKQLAAAPDFQTRDQLIEQLIDRELIRQFLKKRKVSANQDLVDLQMKSIRNLVASKGDNLEDVLQKLNLKEETLKEMLSLQIAWKIHVHRTLTESKIQQFWNENKSHFDGTEVTASQIFLRQKDDKSRLEELSQLRKSISEKSITFEEAAKNHSESPSASKGGDLGSFEFYGSVSEPIAAAAFATKPGAMSEPFQSQFGIHIVKIQKRTPGDLSLEDARPQIIRVLSQQLWDEQVKRERKQARIIISN